MRTLRALSVNAFYATLVILGTFYAVQGAENVVVFWTVLMGAFSPFLATESMAKAYAINRRSGRRFTSYLHITVSVLAIFTFVWFGWMGCAVAKIVSLFCFFMMVEMSKKYKDTIDNSVSTE